jgi:hypothetical protein
MASQITCFGPCRFFPIHVKWVPCHHGMPRPQVAGGGDGVQIWRVAAYTLNKLSRIADRGCFSGMRVGQVDKIPPP